MPPVLRRPATAEGSDEGLDRVLRPVKLPPAGGRSGRRARALVPGHGDRAGRVARGRVRGPRRRTASVLEAREQALPRLPGDPETARGLIPAPQPQITNRSSAQTSTNTSSEVAEGTVPCVSIGECNGIESSLPATPEPLSSGGHELKDLAATANPGPELAGPSMIPPPEIPARLKAYHAFRVCGEPSSEFSVGGAR